MKLAAATLAGIAPGLLAAACAGSGPAVAEGASGVAPRTLRAEAGRAAVQRALPALAGRTADWIDRHGCTSCHQVPFALWALNDARDAGLEVDERVPGWNRWSVERALADTDGDGRVETARHRTDELWELLLAGAAHDTDDPPATADALATLLRDAREDDGRWKARGQLPDQRRRVEETHEATTLWSRLALRAHGTADGLALEPGASETTEHLALRLLEARGADRPERAGARLAELLAEQNPDGGWPWRRAEASDALGTGQALWALAAVGPTPHREAIERAHAFLAATQRPDGLWTVPSTLAEKEGEPYEVSDDWGAAWAVIGLVRTLPE